ncbi:MAG: GGDEF domain-containing protein [Tissierellia bacterium]|nr:GGDEF domain-containing protein [Tissierellia bacterium]
MVKFKNTNEIMEFIRNFNKLYDLIRIVDPISKKIIEYEEVGEKPYSSICYDYWKNGTMCPNCVSSRAINENDTFVKIEYNKDKIYMVMASPAKIIDKNYIVEMLKDITETGIVPDLKGKTVEEINEIINKLNKEIITDELTQVFNRRYLNERLPVDIYASINNKNKLSVIMLDIDFFKNVNDNYGHLAGDFVLKEISNIIKKNIRKDHDWVAKYGGDEFFVSLPNADKKAAYRTAETIKNEVENKEFVYEGQKIHITVSLGVYTLDSKKIIMEELIDITDKNMNEAKIKGRNNIISS